MTFDLFRARRPGQWFQDHDPSLSIKPAAFAQDILNDGATVSVNDGGLTVTDGAITVSNAGETVIIDGTSNMFKIVASGTLAHTQGANSNGSSQAVLTGLGLPTATSPAFVAYLAEGASPANNANRNLGHFWKPRGVIPVWASSTSGGATNTNVVGFLWMADAFSGVDGSNNPAINLGINNAHSASVSASMRYHVLREAAV